MATTKSTLQRMIEKAGFQCRSYSGRGMFGKTCLAVEVDSLGVFFAELVLALDGSKAHTEVFDGLTTMQTDSMGMGRVLYFSNLPYVGDPLCEECGEDEPWRENDQLCGRCLAAHLHSEDA